MKNRFTLKLDIKSLLLSLFVIIALFRPRSFNLYSSISNIFYVYMMLAIVISCIIFVWLVIKKGVKCFGIISYLVIVYEVWNLFCMYINGLLDLSTITSAGALIMATVMTEYLLKKSPKEFIFVLSHYTGILVFINNLSYFSPPSSSYTDATGNLIYFWQTRNHLSSLFFIAVISVIAFNGIHRSLYSRILYLFVVGNVIWGTLVFRSSTTIMGVAVLLIMYFVFQRKSIFYRPVLLFIGALILNLAIVVFRIQDIFSWLIVDVLNRDLTFSHRTYIWDEAFTYILNRPILGYGQSSVFSFSFADSNIPAHNQFLDIAVVCGIPGLIIFLIILCIAFYKLGKQKNSVLSRIITGALLGYMVMAITESPNPYQPWFIMLGMVESLGKLDKMYLPSGMIVSFKNGRLKIRRRKKNEIQ